MLVAVFALLGGGGRALLWRRQAQQLLLQLVLDSQQRRGDVENHLVVRNAAPRDDRPETFDFAVDVATQLAEPENAQCIADLFQ